MQMLGFSGQLLRSCYADVGVFWAVTSMFCLCGQHRIVWLVFVLI